MGPIVCISLVHDCIRLFSFVHLLLFYLSLGGGRLWSCYPPFSDVEFENGLNRLYFVSTWLYTSFFICTPFTFFYLFLKDRGHAIPSFSDFGFENGLNRLYFVSTRFYTSFFVCTPLTFLPHSGWEAGDMLSPFSDFGFENRLNRLYFVSTWSYTFFFVCAPLTFLPLPEGGWGHTIHPFLMLDSKIWAQSFVFC